jgi:hypothetical protein
LHFFFKVLENGKYGKNLLTFSEMVFIEVALVHKNNKAVKTKKQPLKWVTFVDNNDLLRYKRYCFTTYTLQIKKGFNFR